jgi:hypothetical protein
MNAGDLRHRRPSLPVAGFRTYGVDNVAHWLDTRLHLHPLKISVSDEQMVDRLAARFLLREANRK